MSDRLLPLADVMSKVGISSTAIYDRIQKNAFPRPRFLGPRCVRWVESEINDWIAALPPTDASTMTAPQRARAGLAA